jgi:hypothetical protein
MMSQVIQREINQGGTMLIILLVTLVGQMSGASVNAYGVMDEMLVTAPNLQENMLPEVVVTAPRYEGDDISAHGMLPEIVVTAQRYDTEGYNNFITFYGDKVPVHTLGIVLY